VSPLNVYGFSAERLPVEVRGAAGEPVVAIDLDGLFALAGEVAEAPATTAEGLRAHEAAVRRLADECAALLPARFGSVAERLDLAGRRDELLQALDLVRGREQMTLRVYGPQAAADRSSGTAFLESRRRERGVPEIDPLRAAVRALVHAERVETHDASGLRASVYHLIRRGSSPDYLRAVQSVLLDVKVVPSGPWPAWSFAPEAVR
jgi:Gas vesicle synthesis protein GvpL/GvpF